MLYLYQFYIYKTKTNYIMKRVYLFLFVMQMLILKSATALIR